MLILGLGGNVRGVGAAGVFDDEGVDDGENGGENDAAEDVGGPVHVGDDAADGDKDNRGEHE